MSKPQGWELLTLDEISSNEKYSMVDGPFGSNLKISDYVVDEQVPVLQGKNITSDKFEWFDVRYISYMKARELDRSSVKVGDILLTKIGTVGCVAILDDLRGFEKAIIPANLLKLTVNTEKHDTKFVYYSLLNQKETIKGMASQTAQPALSLKAMKQFPILMPQLPEQRKIAAVLSSVDEAIIATQRIIDQTEVVKRGLMQQLLTKGIGHTSFKQTEIGEIPTEWDVLPFGDLVKIQAGYAFKSSEFTDEGDRLLRGSNVGVQEINWSDTKHFPTSRRNEFEQYILKTGDVVIAMDRPFIGNGFKVSRISNDDLPALLLQRVSRIIESERILQDYTYVVLRSELYESQLRSRAVGMDLPHISAKDIGSPLIPVPSVPEQRRIASIMSTIDNKLKNEMSYKAQLEYVKIGLMQVLLAGEVRVNVDEPSEVSV